MRSERTGTSELVVWKKWFLKVATPSLSTGMSRILGSNSADVLGIKLSLAECFKGKISWNYKFSLENSFNKLHFISRYRVSHLLLDLVGLT